MELVLLESLNMTRKLLLLTSIVLFLFLSFNYANKVFQTSFVDEDDNFASGRYILEGEKVYKQFFSHHQPLTYIISAGVQKVINPNSIYLLVKRHREFMIAWSFIWVIFLILRFKIFFLPLLIFEILKIHLLGNLFLSENLVVYPVIYLIGLVLNQGELTSKELIFVGFSVAFIFFNLLPLWGLVAVIILSLIYRQASKLRAAGLTILGGLILFALTLPFIDLPGFFYQSIFINYRYYIPQTIEQPLLWQLINAFTSPVTLIFNDKTSGTLLVSKILAIILILASVSLIKQKKIKKVCWGWFLIGITNLRFIEPGRESFSGFHLMPWLAVFIVVTFYLSLFSLTQSKERWRFYLKTTLLFLIAASLVVSVKFSKALFTKRDIQTDFYVNYSQDVEIGEVIKILKSKTSKLFIAPAKSLIYWQGEVLHASPILYYYAWMEEVPEFKNPTHRLLKIDQPDFVFLERKGTNLEIYLDRYIEVSKHGTGRKLFIHPNIIESLTQTQKDALNFLEFKVN